MTESELVGRNVQRIRRERGLSMAELARRSLLSKQTLSVLESGQGNPTVDTLGALAGSLGVSTRRLLTEWGSPVYVQRKDEAVWVGKGAHRTRELGQIYGSGYVHSNLVQLQRAADAPVARAALDPGALHHVYVIEGRIRCGTANESVDAAAGDFVRFPADVDHLLSALTEECVALVVTTLPQRAQFGLGGVNPALDQ